MTPSYPPRDHLRADIAHPPPGRYRLLRTDKPRRWVVVPDVDAATSDLQIGGW